MTTSRHVLLVNYKSTFAESYRPANTSVPEKDMNKIESGASSPHLGELS